MEVPDESESSADEQNIAANENLKRKKYTSHNWVRDRDFTSFEEAHEFLEQQKFVKFKETDSDRIGMKFYYRCKLIPKAKKIWCAKQYMIHCPHDCLDVIVYHNDLEHNHDELIDNTTKMKLSEEMKDFVKKLFEMQTTQYASVIKHIQNAREKQNLFKNEPNPTKDQIAYRLKLFRDIELKPVVNVGDLMSWCKTHSVTPDDPHTPFVLDYWREKNNGTGLKFRFVFTTLFFIKFVQIS